MKYIKTFKQLNESVVQDPRKVMSDSAWAKASKMRSVILKDQSDSVENPVYFVVGEENGRLVIVIDEKMDNWLGASSPAYKQYYEDVATEAEIEDYKIK